MLCLIQPDLRTEIQQDLWVWVKTMPPLLAFTAGVLWLLMWAFKDELKKAVVRGGLWLVEQMKPPRQPLLTAEQHAEQAMRLMRLHQYTQHMCDELGCDHVTVYASKNGEYLKNHDSIEKLLMQSEAVPRVSPSEPRYMQIRREIYTTDMPDLWHDACRLAYVLRQQGQAVDAFVNRAMRERGYRSILCFQITAPLPAGGRLVLGMASCAWRGFHLAPLDGDPPCVTGHMELLVAGFAVVLSDLMAGPDPAK